MGKLLDWVKGSPSPKKKVTKSNITDLSGKNFNISDIQLSGEFVALPIEEYWLLQIAVWKRGLRAEAQRRLKILQAWKINDDQKN